MLLFQQSLPLHQAQNCWALLTLQQPQSRTWATKLLWSHTVRVPLNSTLIHILWLQRFCLQPGKQFDSFMVQITGRKKKLFSSEILKSSAHLQKPSVKDTQKLKNKFCFPLSPRVRFIFYKIFSNKLNFLRKTPETFILGSMREWKINVETQETSGRCSLAFPLVDLTQFSACCPLARPIFSTVYSAPDGSSVNIYPSHWLLFACCLHRHQSMKIYVAKLWLAKRGQKVFGLLSEVLRARQSRRKFEGT